MLEGRLELPTLAGPVPKTGAYTNSATPAIMRLYDICGYKSLRLAQKHETSRRGGCRVFCAPTWIRTRDHLLKRELLYQLSYRRKQIPESQVAILYQKIFPQTNL